MAVEGLNSNSGSSYTHQAANNQVANKTASDVSSKVQEQAATSVLKKERELQKENVQTLLDSVPPPQNSTSSNTAVPKSNPPGKGGFVDTTA